MEITLSFSIQFCPFTKCIFKTNLNLKRLTNNKNKLLIQANLYYLNNLKRNLIIYTNQFGIMSNTNPSLKHGLIFSPFKPFTHKVIVDYGKHISK